MVLFPASYFQLVGMPVPDLLPLWRVTGMFVLVYAPAYWWAARFPERHRHLVAIGLLGKVLGPIGFLGALVTGALPLAFGWTLLTNDVVWWLPFFLYLRATVRLQGGGWRALLLGR